MQLKSLLLIFIFFVFTVSAAPKKEPIKNELYGNFLQITDIHPDKYYINFATEKSHCHQLDPNGKSSPWGAPATTCDSPLGLVNATFDWLEKNWKNKLDFIIWTGDNSRHDRDDSIPRTMKEMLESNKMISEKFLKAFGNTIPIVPSIGNNDAPKENATSELLAGLYCIWSPYIPKEQCETFLEGGYYYREVIPGKLIVVSLNTLQFFSNKGINGCKKNQPGKIQMEWLNSVLKNARKLGMKVYLTGHISPKKKAPNDKRSTGHIKPRAKPYTDTCYKEYVQLSLKYQDIILGHYYGHSNMDNFFFISDNEEDTENQEQPSLKDKGNGQVKTKQVKNVDKYMEFLINNYRTLPQLPPAEEVAKNYVAVHVNPSIIPTYFPALRICKYNTTEVINENTSQKLHENTFLTPLGYTQYFMNLTLANLYPDVAPEFKVEYTTWENYQMKDLTVLSWIQLARNIANDGFSGSLWNNIQDHLMVGTKSLIYSKK